MKSVETWAASLVLHLEQDAAQALTRIAEGSSMSNLAKKVTEMLQLQETNLEDVFLPPSAIHPDPLQHQRNRTYPYVLHRILTRIKPMRILSIDWDYFYPDSSPYDMGHNENHSPTLSMFLWRTRTTSHNLITGEPLLDAYIPTMPEDFWSKILKNKPIILVADSHFQIWNSLLNETFNSIVTSIDAHHDCGYGPLSNRLDCSNWAAHAIKLYRIKELHLHYPTWRKTNKEPRHKVAPTSVSYKLPESAKYDRIFICRSGAWTTPWHDNQFLTFIKNSGCKTQFLEDLPTRMTMKEARTTCAKQNLTK